MEKSKCPFCNLFGEPNKGVHAPRLFGFAAVDTILTIAAAKLMAIKTRKSFLKSLSQLVLLGIIAHKICGIKTRLNRMIFREAVEPILFDKVNDTTEV